MRQFNFTGFFGIFRITKCAKIILLDGITDCYYKVHQVLKSVTDLITKCDSYYKVRRNTWQQPCIEK